MINQLLNESMTQILRSSIFFASTVVGSRTEPSQDAIAESGLKDKSLAEDSLWLASDFRSLGGEIDHETEMDFEFA